MLDLRATIAAFNDLGCGHTIALGAARQMGLTQSDLAEIDAYIRAVRALQDQVVMCRRVSYSAPVPALPACLRLALSPGKAVAHV